MMHRLQSEGEFRLDIGISEADLKKNIYSLQMKHKYYIKSICYYHLTQAKI